MSDFTFSQNTIAIPCKIVNIIREKENTKISELYQGLFRVFGNMPVNRDNEFVIHKVNAGGLHWTKYRACGSGNGGKITLASETITPCRLSMDLELCADLVGTCFSHLNEFMNGGTALTEEGTAFVEALVREGVRGSGNSLFEALLLSGFHDSLLDESGNPITPDFSLMSEDDRKLLNEIKGACKGLLSLLSEQVDVCPDLFNGEFIGCSYTGDIAEMFEKLFCCAESKDGGSLKSLLGQGFMGEGLPTAVIILTPNLMPSVRKALNEQNAGGSTKAKVFEQSTMAVGNRSVRVMTYLGVPIVPYNALNAWDKYYGKDLVFAAVTTSENLQLGTSYGELPVGGNIGYTMYRDPSPKKANTVEISSKTLVATSIADTANIAWGYALNDKTV